MLVPNKVCNFNSSIISKLPVLLEEIKKKKYNLNDLYEKFRQQFDDISEFIYAIDSLYILDMIEVLEEGEIEYVNRNL